MFITLIYLLLVYDLLLHFLNHQLLKSNSFNCGIVLLIVALLLCCMCVCVCVLCSKKSCPIKSHKDFPLCLLKVEFFQFFDPIAYFKLTHMYE